MKLFSSPYNLTSALYEETETAKYSSVVAVIKEVDAKDITKFEDFRGKRACFGEFGGIGKLDLRRFQSNVLSLISFFSFNRVH